MEFDSDEDPLGWTSRGVGLFFDDDCEEDYPDLDEGFVPSKAVKQDRTLIQDQEHKKIVRQRRLVDDDDDDDVDDLFVGTLLPNSSPPLLSTSISVDIPRSTLVSPRYCYQGHGLPAVEAKEWNAIQKLIEIAPPTEEDDFIEFELDQFAIYIDNVKYPKEMKPLHWLTIKQGHGSMFVDGVLNYAGKRLFVRKIPFRVLSIGNYGSSEHTVKDQIWIQSTMNEKMKNNVYYKFKTPALEYTRYFEGFTWLANFTKYVVDFLTFMGERKRCVVIHDFRSKFDKWVTKSHRSSAPFLKWYRQHGGGDFRTAVVANVEFIYKEAYGVMGHQPTRFHILWKQIREFTAYKACLPISRGSDITTAAESPSPDAINAGPISDEAAVDNTSTGSKRGKPQHIPRTVVTPYTYACFSHLPFGSVMEPVAPSERTERLRNAVIKSQNLELPSPIHISPKHADNFAHRERTTAVQVGDVISTHQDQEQSKWKSTNGFDDIKCWFGLVQKIHSSRDGKRSFDVIWMYRPIDTICGQMKYPWNNELFLSAHCSCGDGHAKVREIEVLAVHKIHWGGSHKTSAEFYCRQTYLNDERRWITFQPAHLHCEHNRPAVAGTKQKYHVGDTILVHLRKADLFVEPCEVVMLPDINGWMKIRRLLRRREIEPGVLARPNELVYTDTVLDIKENSVNGKCIVRFFRQGQKIPTPYDRDGVGNAFYITHRLVGERCLPIEEDIPTSLRQGFNPEKKTNKLHGIDLFCGGGNFGRGLEESGVIEMNWANDITTRAIHTYMANVDDPNVVYPFLGSIDDLQRLALEGRFAENVPQVGKVDFVSGGSPCPGFSRLTVDKTTPAQRKNQSLVAAFASFIDLYRPKYGLLENVVEIVSSPASRSEDVFSQLICAIVGLGYQAQFSLLDAWSYGAPQGRSRVFLCFAAPGCRLPDIPLPTHSHPPTKTRKSLGWLPNGEPMVERAMGLTPFKYVSVSEAMKDLPDIGDSKPDICIPFPDHRIPDGVTRTLRAQFGVIPIQPWEMNFARAWKNGTGVMTVSDRDLFPDHGQRVMKHSRGWGRLHPHQLVHTVTTTPTPTDARLGRQLHWNQERTLSVLEVRRAQGFRDHEVILGKPRDQWATVGNSVAREVSLALGLAFREAWLGSLVDGDDEAQLLPQPLKVLEEAPEGVAIDDSSDSANSGKESRDSGFRRKVSNTPATSISDLLEEKAKPQSPPRKRPYSSMVIELLVSKSPKKAKDDFVSMDALMASQKPVVISLDEDDEATSITPVQGQSHRVTAPIRKDTDFEAVPDFCPPISALPDSPKLMADWPGPASDLSSDPNAHLLHPDEVRLAATLRLDCATYLTSKRRIFERRISYARLGRKFEETDAQQACKIDARKASKLWMAFENVGWLDLKWMAGGEDELA